MFVGDEGIIMAGKKKEDGMDDSIGGFKTRSYVTQSLLKLIKIYTNLQQKKKRKREMYYSCLDKLKRPLCIC